MKKFLAILFLITWTVVLTTAAAFFYKEKHPQTHLSTLNVKGDPMAYFYDGQDLWFVMMLHDSDGKIKMHIIKKK